MSSLLKLDHITKTYTSANRIYTALNAINFILDEGEMTAIVGKSGSGKSTLMNILGLLDVPTSGQYFFKDQELSTLSDDELANIRNQSIGFIFQSFFLLPRSTVIENVMLPLFYRGISLTDAKKRAALMLEKVGLPDSTTKYPHQLSGGQQQRVAIARALVGDPAIILADEPTGALDSQTSSDIMNLLLTLNKEEQRTILIITHDEAISRQCRRVVEIRDGQLV